ncbi:MAG TPA: class I SAM-dependent methyltransferase [Dehalococcoidales bacterium]|nr:class I SAM-dependent methyltransferase [Dehalococcoidales bacterium]
MNPFKDRSVPLTDRWLDKLKKELDESYLKYPEAWKQAGFLEDEQAWIQCRKPIADCVDKSGAFLDISCSNGYLLECLVKWSGDRGFKLVPWGIDLSEKLIALARSRLSDFSANFTVGSALKWTSPQKFDFVRTELSYVLDESQEQYLQRVFSNYVNPDGKVIITEYRTKKQDIKEPWSTDKLVNWDFAVVKKASAVVNNRELLRLCVLMRKGLPERSDSGVSK